jgi:gliding motility-associated-like protein
MTYYYKQLLFAVLIALFYQFSFGQGCPNANFSQNNFNAWSGFTGNYNNPGQTPGIVNGRHTIINAQAVDPYSCGGLNMIPPGATSSCRLGNDGTGAQGEQLRYQMTVDASNALFVYKYAVVLEDPGHTPAEQPEFRMRILNQAGGQIGGSCGIYTVYGGQPGQNFQTCGGVTWLPWTIVGVDLTAYMGQTIQVEFSTKDCSQSGHFGYAYISAECMPLLLDVAYCEGSNAVTISAPPGFQSYSWAPGGQNTQSITVNNPVIGSTYTCTMTTFSNQGNCTVSLGAQVFPTSVYAGFDFGTACANAPLQFTDTSTVTNGTISGWDWDFGDGQTSTAQNPAHTFTASGAYNVQLIVSSDEGCTDTIEQTVNVDALPNVQFALTNECINDLVSFDNQTPDAPPLIFTWDFGDGSAFSALEDPTHTYTAAGTYTVELLVENSNGCQDSLSQPITIYPLPVIGAGPDVQICPGTAVTVNGSGGSTYVWDNSVTDGVAFNPAAAGTYTVTGTDANGCVNTDQMQVTLFPDPVVDAGPDVEVCTGTSVTFSGSGAASYVWDGGVIDGQSFVPAVGSYTFTVTGTDANGCVDTDDADLVVNPNPVVNAGPDQLICPGATTAVSGSGAATYQWDNNVVNNQTFSPANSATYTVIGTSAEGCTGTDQMQIAIEPPTNPSFNAPVREGCEPLDVNLTNTSTGTVGASCYWEFGDGTNASTCGSIYHQYPNPGCYDVTLTVTTALGCVWTATVADYICVFPNPVAAFTPTPGIMDELNPTSVMSNSSTGATYYSWNFGDGSSQSTEEEPEHTFPTDPISNYVIDLTAITEHGCIDTVSHVIVMNPVLIYYVPNTFTPDDDEFNQTFQPVFTSGFDPYDFNMLIYNRWGEAVFETNDASKGWDGTYNGVIVKEGAYTWKIEFKTTANDERKFVMGHVNVLR